MAASPWLAFGAACIVCGRRPGRALTIAAPLTEAQSYTVEARRAEELAHRLESQVSWFEGNSAAGSLNLSQAYREWGIAEIEANRDYYGAARFDDIDFQLSARGQELQARFVANYADRLHDEIDDKLTLPEFGPIAHPSIGSAADARGRASVGGSGGRVSPAGIEGRVEAIGDEVRERQREGRDRVGRVRSDLQSRTRKATGASSETADDVKEW